MPNYFLQRGKKPIIYHVPVERSDGAELNFFTTGIRFLIQTAQLVLFGFDIPSQISHIIIGGSGGGGRHQRVPLQQDQFLSFSHMFSPKSVCVRGQHPPNGLACPPMGNHGSATDNDIKSSIMPKLS